MKTGIFLDRDKNRIDSKEIVLNRGEYVYYVSKNCVTYCLLNANHKLVVTKPLSIKEIKTDKRNFIFKHKNIISLIQSLKVTLFV